MFLYYVHLWSVVLKFTKVTQSFIQNYDIEKPKLFWLCREGVWQWVLRTGQHFAEEWQLPASKPPTNEQRNTFPRQSPSVCKAQVSEPHMLHQELNESWLPRASWYQIPSTGHPKQSIGGVRAREPPEWQAQGTAFRAILSRSPSSTRKTGQQAMLIQVGIRTLFPHRWRANLLPHHQKHKAGFELWWGQGPLHAHSAELLWHVAPRSPLCQRADSTARRGWGHLCCSWAATSSAKRS